MISVIIPTLNEEENLPRSIEAVFKSSRDCEVLVVDCGSADGTQLLARELGAGVIVTGVRQRAAQLNSGARHARGDVFLFLHADTMVPEPGLGRIAAALKDEQVGGGAFARRFDSASPFLRMTCWLAELRNQVVGWHLGDQGIFVRRTCFEQLGGFGQMDRFEDLQFSRRLGGLSKVVTLRPPVISSARRFAADGPVKRTVKDFLLTMAYLRGKREAVTHSKIEPKGAV